LGRPMELTEDLVSVEGFGGVEGVEDPAGVGQGCLQVEAGGQALVGQPAGDLGVGPEDLEERPPLLPGGHGGPLGDAVGGVAVEPFCAPLRNGSAASPTSVRWRWRISRAKASTLAATEAQA